MKKFLCILPLIAMLAACDQTPTSTQIERRAQEEMSKRGVESVGFPAVNNFAEKRMMKDILELRDQMKPTYTYIMDMNGRPHKVCDSVGYGLPYATQYTDPHLADPNGLYTPASADGTWVLCLDPKVKKVKPVYIEPRIIVSPFPLQ